VILHEIHSIITNKNINREDFKVVFSLKKGGKKNDRRKCSGRNRQSST
jgi:hypothetical protein